MQKFLVQPVGKFHDRYFFNISYVTECSQMITSVTVLRIPFFVQISAEWVLLQIINQHGSTDSRPSANVKMNLDTGKYHAKLLTITREQWLKIIFCHKQHISFHHKIPEGRSKETKQLTAVPNDVISYACLLYTSPSPRDLSTSRMPSSA